MDIGRNLTIILILLIVVGGTVVLAWSPIARKDRSDSKEN